MEFLEPTALGAPSKSARGQGLLSLRAAQRPVRAAHTCRRGESSHAPLFRKDGLDSLIADSSRAAEQPISVTQRKNKKDKTKRTCTVWPNEKRKNETKRTCTV